jgi:tRNA dimethylallyltransferase
LKYLITIIGPTAIGKTSLSIALAQFFCCEIISCDSRQFFKEMKIGTAVPSAVELGLAKHHFIQNKSIFQPYSVGDFEKEAIKKLAELFLTNDYAILVGGSGLYVDAILNGLDTFPEIDNAIKEIVNTQYEQFGLPYLQEQLAKLDPVFYDNISRENPQTLQNPQRLLRFVSVCLGTGKPYSTFLKKNENKRSFVPIIIGLTAERATIYDRINQRVEEMMKEGLVQEAERLYPNKNLNALQTVGYQELFDFFENKITVEFAIAEIKKNTRRFAKRQLTWFKRNEQTKWFDYPYDLQSIIDFIENFDPKQ